MSETMNIAQVRLCTNRRQDYAELPRIIRSISVRVHAGVDTSGGEEGEILDVLPNPMAYHPISAGTRAQVHRLSTILTQLSASQSLTLCDLGQEKLDLALALLLDVSESIPGLYVHKLAVMFNDTLLSHKRHVHSGLFAYNNRVYRCGAAARNNGIAGVACEGAALEHFGTRVAGNWLKPLWRTRKILLTICNGRPTNPALVCKEVDALTRHGIVPIRVIVGTNATARTHPVELYFEDWPDFFHEFEQFSSVIFLSSRV